MTSINWQFISDLEGGQRLEGKVPDADDSGVTIATGFDVGQNSESDLSGLGIPETLKKKLIPYVMLQRSAAEAALRKKPLIITRQEADILDRLVKARIVDLVRKNYNNSVKSGRLKFSTLPRQAQTVIVSVAFQHGPNLKQAAPIFWGFALSRDWENMHKVLNDFEDLYPTRRKKEARLIKELIRKKSDESEKDIMLSPDSSGK